eukprot:scaffold39222_cov34-Prasinocladus_malaysianus.AAC.1
MDSSTLPWRSPTQIQRSSSLPAHSTPILHVTTSAMSASVAWGASSVYHNATTNPLTLDVGVGRVVSIGYKNWPDVVVWSPWTDMKDCYQEFVCVENAACSPVKVAAGATWSGSMTLTTNVTDPIDTLCANNPEADECRVYSD